MSVTKCMIWHLIEFTELDRIRAIVKHLKIKQ